MRSNSLRRSSVAYRARARAVFVARARNAQHSNEEPRVRTHRYAAFCKTSRSHALKCAVRRSSVA
eukprot:4578249-Lingulodinium_polyedra.AAC.1